MKLKRNNFNDQQWQEMRMWSLFKKARESIKIHKLWHFKVFDKTCLKHLLISHSIAACSLQSEQQKLWESNRRNGNGDDKKYLWQWLMICRKFQL
jgi:hypothetical protein